MENTITATFPPKTFYIAGEIKTIRELIDDPLDCEEFQNGRWIDGSYSSYLDMLERHDGTWQDVEGKTVYKSADGSRMKNNRVVERLIEAGRIVKFPDGRIASRNI